MNIKQKIIGVLLAIVAILGGSYAVSSNKLGNVSVGNQLQSTTTPQVADQTVLCTGTGVLGSVHALKNGTGELGIFDATTTNVTKRTGNLATSSIILAWYPAGFGTTTNAFNLEFKRGLLIDYTTGVATSTISYRCES